MSEPTNAITDRRFVDELFAIQRELSFRDPMLDAVRRRSIGIGGLRLWALQASLVVKEFTRFISAIHANCQHRQAQQLLAENLWEEHGEGINNNDHYSLIRKLARSMGATDRELNEVQPLHETTEYIDHCLKITRELSFVESMTAIAIGIEIYMPAFFGALADALCSSYGLTRDDVEYLMVHVVEDKTHARRALELIEEYANTPAIKENCKQALREILHVKTRFALAVYDHCASSK
jgi:pyrroloquinoline quinone (PQQ) biosynthesis protein C